MNIRQTTVVCLAALLFVWSSLKAELNIEITQGMVGAVPIAVISESATDAGSSGARVSFANKK